MAEPLTINVQEGAGAAPAVYTVPGSVEVEPLSAFASFDGTAAAASFLPSLAFYSASGFLITRTFPDAVAAGASADVSYFPGVGVGSTATVAGGCEYAVAGSTNAIVCNAGGANTVMAPFQFGHWSDNAFNIDTAVGHIELLETGLYVCSVEIVFAGYFAPMTATISANVNPGGSIWPDETASQTYTAHNLNAPGMLSAGPSRLGLSGSFVVEALDPTQSNNFVRALVDNDSGAAHSTVHLSMQVIKIGDLP